MSERAMVHWRPSENRNWQRSGSGLAFVCPEAKSPYSWRFAFGAYGCSGTWQAFPAKGGVSRSEARPPFANFLSSALSAGRSAPFISAISTEQGSGETQWPLVDGCVVVIRNVNGKVNLGQLRYYVDNSGAC